MEPLSVTSTSDRRLVTAFSYLPLSQVIFNRDLLITHMVSPEGEQLELVEIIDPKGQNVEAWLLELEGKMRLTVRAETGVHAMRVR